MASTYLKALTRHLELSNTLYRLLNIFQEIGRRTTDIWDPPMQALSRHKCSVQTIITCYCLILVVIPPAHGQSNDTGDQLQITWTATQPIQCEPYEFFWTGGTPPFALTIRPVNDTHLMTYYEVFGLQDRFYVWSGRYPSGTAVTLIVEDDKNVQTFNDGPFVIQSSSNDSCIVPPDSPFTIIVEELLTASSPSFTSTSSSLSTSSSSLILTTHHASTASRSRHIPSSLSTTHLLDSNSSHSPISTTISTATTSSHHPTSTETSPSLSPAPVTPVAPSTLVSFTTPHIPPSSEAGSGDHRSRIHTAAYAGIATGSAVVLLLTTASWFIFWRKRARARQASALSPRGAFVNDPDPFYASSQLPTNTRPPDATIKGVSPIRAHCGEGPQMLPTNALLAHENRTPPTIPRYARGSDAPWSAQPSSASFPDWSSRASPALRSVSPSSEMAMPASASSLSMPRLRSREDLVHAVSFVRSEPEGRGSPGLAPRAQSPRVETDGGVRLAGGPPEEIREDGEDEIPDGDDAATLPPPYHRYCI